MCNLPVDESAFSLVSDANFLFYLLEALVNAVENDSPGLSRGEMFDRFMGRLHHLLDGVASRTTDGKFLISSRVHEEEVRPTNSNSSLRKKLSCIETMCQRLNQKYQLVEQCLLHHLEIIPVSEEHVHSLMQHFHAELRPDDRDASLLFLALRKCSQTRTCLLTDDQGLIDACDHIIRQGQVVTACGTFEAGNLAQMKYMDFLMWAHDACHVSSEDFKSCFNFKLAINYEALEKVGRSGRRSVQKELDKATNAFLSSVMVKAQAASASMLPQAS